MRYITALLLLFFASITQAQVLEPVVRDTVELDSVAPVVDVKYREDQFYASVSYNMMQEKPGNYSQYSFSTCITAGFLRDMPINKGRTYAVAAGLGYSYNNIKHNMIVENIEGVNTYKTLGKGDFEKNKLVLHYLELPIELRWRNSDSINHKFWRVYLGFKVSYLFASKAHYEPDGNTKIKVRNDPNINDFVYGAYISTGWNTWNLYAYYGLSPIYNSAPIEGTEQKLTMRSLNFGLIFYIL